MSHPPQRQDGLLVGDTPVGSRQTHYSALWASQPVTVLLLTRQGKLGGAVGCGAVVELSGIAGKLKRRAARRRLGRSDDAPHALSSGGCCETPRMVAISRTTSASHKGRIPVDARTDVPFRH